ncbi:MAG TPA: low-specificity L-threonine aldolase [Gammaproteobacteria bacterium]|nr:low-specificity L-threonine aldolase [Gammaproteobacteria bacterium]
MIDLRSDTTTQPSEGMRRRMASAPVGDDVFGDDPTVNALQERVANLAGKDAALLLPSGTQSNLVALLSHCQRGEEYLVGQDYHTYLYEAGGAAVFGSIQPQPIPVSADGTLDLELVQSLIKPDDPHFALSKLLVLENTHNGKVLGLDYMAQASALAQRHGLSLHLDGARIFNAATELGVELKEIVGDVDSVSICFSKGLGAPVGSLLCGSDEFIAAAKRWRKMAGGGLRQAGVLAAAIDYALDHHVDRLKSDHANAKRIAEAVSGLDAVTLLSNQTNMVFIELADEDTGAQFGQFLAERGINALGGKRMRLVAHLGISEQDTDAVIASLEEYFTL